MIHLENNIELNSFISKNRQTLMGISIIAILLYHAYVWITPQDINLLRIFTYGYAGVDIFMFLSGWGLCYSYYKNNISSFYYRRFKRIFPLTILSGLIVSLFVYRYEESFTYWDIICTISTLYYYGLGGAYWNWFIPGIIILYISFPILLYFSKKLGLYFFTIVNITIILIIWGYQVDWRYSCLICRLPIFVTGIMVYLNQKNEDNLVYLFMINMFFFIISCSFNLSDYYLTATFCPLLLLSLYYLKNIILTITIIERMGKYTLEIFLGNSISYYVLHVFIRYNNNLYLELLVYIISTFFWTLVYIYLNRIIQIGKDKSCMSRNH